MENKKNNKLYIIIGILIVLIVLALTYIVYDKVINKPKTNEEPQINNTNNNDNNNVNTSIDNVVIKNEEVKALYKYLDVTEWPTESCYGYFYNHSLKSHTLEEKMAFVLDKYSINYEKKIDDTFYKKLSKADRNFINESGFGYYVEKSTVTRGMKLLFNINLDEFDINKFGTEHPSYWWIYIKSAEAFVHIQGGGEQWSYMHQQIIEYNELSDEINFTVAGALFETPSELIGTDDDIITYVYDKDKKLYSKDSETFKFTKDNIDKFKQLKYVFKKNNEGKYYLSDVINLNFETKAGVCK